MSEDTFQLNELPIGRRAKVLGFRPECSIKRRLMDLGLTKGATVEAVQKSPLGDPVAYLIRGALIAIREEDSAAVTLCW